MPRLRISLRWLLFVMAVCGVLFAILAKQERERHSLIQEICADGGQVEFAKADGFLSILRQRVIRAKIPEDFDPTRLNKFAGFNVKPIKGCVMADGSQAYTNNYAQDAKRNDDGTYQGYYTFRAE